jgi:hypothetical protein
MIYQNMVSQQMPRKRRLTAHRGDMSEVMMTDDDVEKEFGSKKETIGRSDATLSATSPAVFEGRSQKSRDIRSTCERVVNAIRASRDGFACVRMDKDDQEED